ncbi:MAG: T9SS type A sorting domain-containing protein, partial [Bacteroidia bacterium]|nr:T9SS type A sorting domain-containing protein [Bacteroidia bacterium]
KVYPNPTSNFLTLSISHYTTENFSFVVMGIDGRIISTGEITGNETIISMESLASGQYLVNINSNSRLVKSFKVIKN